MLNTNRFKYYILIFILIVSIQTISLVNHEDDKKNFLQIQSAIETVQNSKLELVLTHLWFEELVYGDDRYDMGFIRNKFFNLISTTKSLSTNPILIDQRSKILNLIKDIEKLKRFTIKRYSKSLKAGTNEDQMYDDAFNNILKDFTKLNNNIKNIAQKNLKKIEFYKRIYFMFYIFIIIILFIIIYFIEKNLKNTIEDNKIKDQIIHKSEKLASMGEMIGNIAHQWRQPLSVISTAATGMKVQKEFNKLDDKTFNEFCDAINNNTQYLSRTIDDFRNFIKEGREKNKFLLSKTIYTSLNLVNSSIKKYKIDIELNMDEKINIVGFENELIQALINIFNNAKDELIINDINIKYILISTQKKDNNAIIKIKDNAGGIKNDIIDKVFDPYFTTKHKSQGTGLGLSMTYNLIKNGMNGNIEVYNETFKYKGVNYTGALFKITIPLN